MYRSLLVPLDGSSFAEPALPVAQAIARRAGARLHLVSVVTPLAEAYVEGMYFSTADLELELSDKQKAYLDGVSRRLREHTEVPVSTAVHNGEVAPTLCQLASSGDI